MTSSSSSSGRPFIKRITSSIIGFLILGLLSDNNDGSSSSSPSFVVAASAADATKEEENGYSCFDDASWAVVSNQLSSKLDNNKQKIYDDFLESCNEALREKSKNDRVNCINDEDFRLLMNSKQPASVYNYTKDGYTKIKAPPELFNLIKEFYETNKGRAEVEWKSYNTYHNMWDVPPTIVHINRAEHGGSVELKNKALDLARVILEEWTGQLLTPVSIYGIRIYHEGSILAPHVDRMPLVSSAIINVDQDVDEPWPLEVYGRDGKAVNITMEPGDMIMYESHSIIHGRPFPLKGKFYSNLFFHFEPLPNEIDDEVEKINDLPPYLIPGSEWEIQWRTQNPRGYKNALTSPHQAAQSGDIHALTRLGKTSPTILHRYDKNGWLPLHEAVRSGQIKAVQIILLNGGDVNKPTSSGIYPLKIAYNELGEEHEMTKFLLGLGAVEQNEAREAEL